MDMPLPAHLSELRQNFGEKEGGKAQEYDLIPKEVLSVNRFSVAKFSQIDLSAWAVI